ncbi:MAG: type II toxin-antitoxin system PemK/MazF family toxin [Acidimicrobiia bacterium]|nr:type II toxin-antitoxin system PemK/MazF family toxin [Microthrixaceae bacterium]RTL06102.1 MAG: type II toxin-antitoxin system PemK/MazF family toxin [Acidimicrobiia bacterium]HMS90371.1 type II toxin-antitoxin system PemK/MazF family toxin [Acidimicrobiales bacterium]
MTDLPRRGELWWCELPEIGSRPVVVVSRDVAIPRLGRTLIAPCTTTISVLGRSAGRLPAVVNGPTVRSSSDR